MNDGETTIYLNDIEDAEKVNEACIQVLPSYVPRERLYRHLNHQWAL